MALYRPRSLLKLVLYGFGIVALPLMAALAYGGLQIERLAERSQQVVYSGLQATQAGRTLSEQITAMERSARQYLLLQDEELLEVYAEHHRQFLETLGSLRRLPSDARQRARIEALADLEEQLRAALMGGRGEPPDPGDIVRDFQALTELSRNILRGAYQRVDQDVVALQKRAAGFERLLLWLAIALVPLTLASSALFTVLISRPIRQVDRAIHRLGDGRFDLPIRVRGPQDLQYLGDRLDWLRGRLQELEEQKTRFLHHVSHELKTPLTAIRESSALLKDQVVGPLNEQQQAIAEILESNARALQRLIEDLLRFGTAQGEPPPLSLETVEMQRLVEEVLRNHQPAALTKQLRLNTRLKPMSVRGDRDKLATVVDNLLSNAVKFCRPGGEVRVELSRQGSQVRLDVYDEGPGIPEEEAEEIFGAFCQGSARPSGYVGGSGLGLSIAREYVLAHQGSIMVLNDQAGGGHLRVELPLRPQGNHP
ncbi:sensor histidine kinase [Alkalilimnicola sp. S0819]|uniref:sensor histidine kinase n=1 Tax=Alkalilimnicola sp. S0819 TaxID=2613922 RepID=UPI0012623920|nr:HAMP domain-containing sensor histidine kinase [Alkalilimnicola sp. S0819]KAB7628288.1 HAMP domain-containing histidine kinase [Alkalilimnicola sp. S0819]MPQ15185.1 histidine kinase [Alkalilimnicola sp. S0819]